MTDKYWILNLGSKVKDHLFYLTLTVPAHELPVWHDNRILFLVRDGFLAAVCRVARLRKKLDSTEVLLDRRVDAPDEWQELG